MFTALKKTTQMVAAFALLVGLSSIATAQYPGQYPAQASLSGNWEGRWYNSHGSSGPDFLEITEFRNGEIDGFWGVNSYPVTGQRIGPNRYDFEASGNGKTYEGTGRLSQRGERLRIDYTVTYEKSGEVRQYRGWSELSRVD